MTRISRPGQRKESWSDSVTVRSAEATGIHRRRVRTWRALREGLPTPRPMTVWACADHHHPAATGLLAGWLHTAVVKIVTSYTQPGDRVLLLAPHTVAAESTAGWPGTVPATVRSTARTRSQQGPLGGLHEAGWTVVRLGRDVVNWTTTTDAVPPAVTSSPSDVSVRGAIAESESGPGPGGETAIGSQGRSECELDPVGYPSVSPETDPTGPAEDRFDAIIATVDPSHTDWLGTLDWPTLLTPRGVVAVVTYGDIGDGHLVDPVGSIVTALRGRRMSCHDRVVLLGTPLSRITALPGGYGADSGCSALDTQGRSGPYAAVSSSRAYADLLIFNRSAVANTPSVNPRSSVETSDV